MGVLFFDRKIIDESILGESELLSDGRGKQNFCYARLKVLYLIGVPNKPACSWKS